MVLSSTVEKERFETSLGNLVMKWAEEVRKVSPDGVMLLCGTKKDKNPIDYSNGKLLFGKRGEEGEGGLMAVSF